MKVLIEKYREFDIEFDTEYEVFTCIATEEDAKQSKSFKAVKKFIDEYVRKNHKFEPFRVINNPDRNWGRYKYLTIIGVRKDGRFTAMTPKGEKIQLSDYEAKDYILESEVDPALLDELYALRKEEKKMREKFSEEEGKIICKIKQVTLKSLKGKFSWDEPVSNNN